MSVSSFAVINFVASVSEIISGLEGHVPTVIKLSIYLSISIGIDADERYFHGFSINLALSTENSSHIEGQWESAIQKSQVFLTC